MNGKAIRLQNRKHGACRCGFAGVREVTTRRQCRICKPGGRCGVNSGQVPERNRAHDNARASRMEGMIQSDIERLLEVAVMPAVAQGARCE